MFNPASVGAAAGIAGGGVLGQLGDLMSAPRRAAWDLAAQGLGAIGVGDGTAPASGADLLGQTFGMDQDSPWTQALGVGAEMALDPMTYAGFALGGPMGKVWGQASGQAARVAGLEAQSLAEVQGLAAARRAAQQALVDRAAGEAATRERYVQQALGLMDVPGVQNLAGAAGGMTREYQAFTPEVLAAMENSGLGQLTEQGTLETLGHRPPLGTQAAQVRGPIGGQMAGSRLQWTPDTFDVDMMGDPYPMPNGYRTGVEGMDPLLPDELRWLQQRTADELGNGEIGGPSRWRSLMDPAADYRLPNLLGQYAHENAQAANLSRPMPTLGMSMRDQMVPYGGLPESLLQAPVPQAFDQSQNLLAQAQSNLKRAQMLKAQMQMGQGDVAQIGLGAALGGYAGGMMGFNQGPTGGKPYG